MIGVKFPSSKGGSVINQDFSSYALIETGTTVSVDSLRQRAATDLGVSLGNVKFIHSELYTKRPFNSRIGNIGIHHPESIDMNVGLVPPYVQPISYHTIANSYSTHVEGSNRWIAPDTGFLKTDLIALQLSNSEYLLWSWNNWLEIPEFTNRMFPLYLKTSGNSGYNYRVYRRIVDIVGQPSGSYGMRLKDSSGNTLFDSRHTLMNVADQLSFGTEEFFNNGWWINTTSRKVITYPSGSTGADFKDYQEIYLTTPNPDGFFCTPIWAWGREFPETATSSSLMYLGLSQKDENTLKISGLRFEGPYLDNWTYSTKKTSILSII